MGKMWNQLNMGETDRKKGKEWRENQMNQRQTQKDGTKKGERRQQRKKQNLS